MRLFHWEDVRYLTEGIPCGGAKGSCDGLHVKVLDDGLWSFDELEHHWHLFARVPQLVTISEHGKANSIVDKFLICRVDASY